MLLPVRENAVAEPAQEKGGIPEPSMYLFSDEPVLISASGLQGQTPLVDRLMWVREVGKLDP
ncbi:MAG: hypothetical protein GY938_12835 [Ketobacter sp.]|nr:hypothetical protein [Ketobacter sp.]